MFLAGVVVHVGAALTAVVSGAAAMLSRKGPGRHAGAGKVYCWSLAVVSVTALPLLNPNVP